MQSPANRSDINSTHLWDVDSVYATPAVWEEDFKKLDGMLQPVVAMQGKLKSPAAVAKAFVAQDALGLLQGKLYLYAHMKEDEDTNVSDNQARMSRIRSEFAKISGATAWIQPEILEQDEETLRAWTSAAELKDYRRSMELLVREKPHTLSAQEETLLGLAGDVLSNPYESFGKLTNADLKFENAVDAEGNEHPVSNGSLGPLLQSRDRVLRKNAWGSLYKTYREHENVLASLLGGSTKNHVFNANVRKFDGALEASLFNDNIPTDVYMSLIQAVHTALPAFYDYVDLRAKMLGLEGDLNMWDLHVPIVPEFDVKVEWKQCEEWVRESTKPLGPDYQEGVLASFRERWYDVFENTGKRSGAYSTGSFGQKPFMLLNYHGTLNDVFTTAHELGHSMHTFMSHKFQPYRYSDYPIFLAEIASTTNEALLHHYLVETQTDPQFRAYLLNHLCDSFKGTMFRQTMFAEFELEIHRRLERGEAITAKSLREYYYELNAKYYGPRVKADERIAAEWSRIPHFYYNFYVYKYATGFAAAQIFSQRILSGAAGRDAYLGFLKSGSSRDPLDTTRAAGVDLADPAVLTQAFANFKSAVKELRGVLVTA